MNDSYTITGISANTASTGNIGDITISTSDGNSIAIKSTEFADNLSYIDKDFLVGGRSAFYPSVASPDQYLKPITEKGKETAKEKFLTIDQEITKADTIGWTLAYWSKDFPSYEDVAIKVGFVADDDAWLSPFKIFVEGSKWTGLSVFVSPECDSAYFEDEDNELIESILEVVKAGIKQEFNGIFHEPEPEGNLQPESGWWGDTIQRLGYCQTSITC